MPCYPLALGRCLDENARLRSITQYCSEALAAGDNPSLAHRSVLTDDTELGSRACADRYQLYPSAGSLRLLVPRRETMSTSLLSVACLELASSSTIVDMRLVKLETATEERRFRVHWAAGARLRALGHVLGTSIARHQIVTRPPSTKRGIDGQSKGTPM
jgi:hypothetical protein